MPILAGQTLTADILNHLRPTSYFARASAAIAGAGTDTDTVGRYDAEWEVTIAASKKQSFPGDGCLTIVVLDDLG